MKLYKFRDLSLKDQMRIEVDFGGEPVEIDEEKILGAIVHEFKTFGDGWYLKQELSDAFDCAVRSIKQLLT